jgi:hypothetical protein
MEEFENEKRKTTKVLEAKVKSGLVDPEKVKLFNSMVAKMAEKKMHTYPMKVAADDIKKPPSYQQPPNSVYFDTASGSCVFVGEPIESKFVRLVAGPGKYNEAYDSYYLWQKTYGSYQVFGMSRSGFYNDVGKIGKNELWAITEVYDHADAAKTVPGANVASVENPSLRLALLAGYMDFEIPSKYFPGITTNVRITPYIDMKTQRVEIDKPVYFEEHTQAYFQISTSLHQTPINPMGTTSAKKVFVDKTDPLKDYVGTLANPGFCEDLALTAYYVDSNKPLIFSISFLQWVYLCSVGGSLTVSIENIFGASATGTKVPFLRLCIVPPPYVEYAGKKSGKWERPEYGPDWQSIAEADKI